MCFSFPVFFIFISSHRYFGQKPRNLGENTLMMGWLPQNDLLGKAGLSVCERVYVFERVCVPLATSLEFSPNHSKIIQGKQHLCGSKSLACCESDL